MLSEEIEDTNGVIKSRNLKNRQYHGQQKRDKQRSTKHYTKG